MANQEKETQELKGALLKANQEIEKLSRIKADFISIISHELRTPLTSIKESVSLVLDGIAGPLTEEQKKFLTITKNNIDRLTKLITDVLDLSKLESGRIMMHKRKLNINELIKEVYASTKAGAEQKNIQFSISLGESVEPVWFDPDRIGQVLKNLISNAIKFNKSNGWLKISSSKENINSKDFIRIIVEDNGVGIVSEDIENLFRNFSPLDTGMTREHGGAGLGLAISRGIIELHGGDIWVVSEPDAGSKFIFTIPIYGKYEEFDLLMEEAMTRSKQNDKKISLILFKAESEKDNREDITSKIEGVIKNTVRGPEDKVARFKREECIAVIAYTGKPGAMMIVKRIKDSVRTPIIFGASIYPDEAIDKDELIKKAEDDLESGKNVIIPKKILLIIDNEEDMVSMLSFRLKGRGFDIVIARDGEKGVELAKKNKPDIILLDLMMPRVDGFEASKRLKKDPDTMHIPIVVLSAVVNKNTKEYIEQLGAEGFIEKPFEPEDLIKKIEKILGVKNE